MDINLFAIQYIKIRYDLFDIKYYLGNYDAELDVFTYNKPAIEVPHYLSAVETRYMTKEFASAISQFCHENNIEHILDHCWLWDLKAWDEEDIPAFVKESDYDIAP